MLWRTTALRSPCCSAEPSSEVNFLFCRMLRMASDDGAQVPLDFCRQSSLSEARTETTTLRVSGFSALAVLKDAPSWRAASVGVASEMATAICSAGDAVAAGFSERTDMLVRVVLFVY